MRAPVKAVIACTAIYCGPYSFNLQLVYQSRKFKNSQFKIITYLCADLIAFKYVTVRWQGDSEQTSFIKYQHEYFFNRRLVVTGEVCVGENLLCCHCEECLNKKNSFSSMPGNE